MLILTVSGAFTVIFLHFFLGFYFAKHEFSSRNVYSSLLETLFLSVHMGWVTYFHSLCNVFWSWHVSIIYSNKYKDFQFLFYFFTPWGIDTWSGLPLEMMNLRVNTTNTKLHIRKSFSHCWIFNAFCHVPLPVGRLAFFMEACIMLNFYLRVWQHSCKCPSSIMACWA